MPFGIYDVLLFLMAAVWGGNFVAMKTGTALIHSSVFNLMRFGIGVAALGAILIFSKHPLTLPRRDWLNVIYLAFISTVVYQLMFINGLQLTTAANSSLILNAAPVLLVLINVARGRDRIGRNGMIGSLLAFVGVISVVLASHVGGVQLGGDSLRGDLLIVGAAFAWVWSVLASRDVIQRNDPLTFSFWHGCWITILQLFVALPDLPQVQWSTVNWGGVIPTVLYAGLGAFCIAGLIWNNSIQKIGTTRTAIYNNLQPIVAAIAGMIILSEPFTPMLIVGTILVLIGVILVKRG